jgi:hypothetical protein
MPVLHGAPFTSFASLNLWEVPRNQPRQINDLDPRRIWRFAR